MNKSTEGSHSKGEWRRLHKEELCALYFSPSIMRVIKSKIIYWAQLAAHMGKRRGACSILVGKPEERRPFGIPRRRWEDTIKVDL
jgi:hypothetical protein